MSPKSKRAVTRNQQLPSDDGNMTTEDEVVAYVDESMRTREGITTYYLCAVIDVGIREVDLDGSRSLLGTQGLADVDGVVPTELDVPWKRIEKHMELRRIEL